MLFSLAVQFSAVFAERLTPCASNPIVRRDFAPRPALRIVVVVLLLNGIPSGSLRQDVSPPFYLALIIGFSQIR